MALGSLVQITSGLLDLLGLAGSATEAGHHSMRRTRAPSWRAVGAGWLFVAATGAALWSQRNRIFDAYPKLAVTSGVIWVIALFLVLLATGAAVELLLIRRHRQRGSRSGTDA